MQNQTKQTNALPHSYFPRLKTLNQRELGSFIVKTEKSSRSRTSIVLVAGLEGALEAVLFNPHFSVQKTEAQKAYITPVWLDFKQNCCLLTAHLVPLCPQDCTPCSTLLTYVRKCKVHNMGTLVSRYAFVGDKNVRLWRQVLFSPMRDRTMYCVFGWCNSMSLGVRWTGKVEGMTRMRQ